MLSLYIPCLELDHLLEDLIAIHRHPHTVEINEKQFVTEEERRDGDYGINVTILPWIILSKDSQMIIPVDSVLTVVEPLETVTQLYLDKLKSFEMEEEEEEDD